MSDQFQRERKRHPDQLAAEVITLRRKVRDLEHRLDSMNGLPAIIPDAYTEAIGFAYFVAHGKPMTQAEVTSRGAPASRPPAYNVAALRILKREQASLNARSRWLRSSTEQAAENPTGPLRNTDPSRGVA